MVKNMDKNKIINHVIKLYNCYETINLDMEAITHQEFCTQDLWELNLVYFDKLIQTYTIYFNINYAYNIFTRYNIKNTELIRWWSLCKFKRLFHWIWLHNSKIMVLQSFSEEALFNNRLLMTLFEDEQYIEYIDIYAYCDQLAKYGFNDKHYKYIMNMIEKCKNQRLVLDKTEYVESE